MGAGFTKFANAVAHAVGKPVTFVLCCLVVIVWAASGPMFGFSDTWQLIINTGTTIITFLMVFLIQNTQNRDGAAIQAKLDELIQVGEGRNALIGIERLTDEEIEQIRKTCEKRAKAADAEADAAKNRAHAAEQEKDAAKQRAEAADAEREVAEQRAAHSRS